MLKKIIGKQGKKFVLNAIVVWVISQSTLHLLLLIVNVPIATLTSQIVYVFLGFKFYSKYVFEKINYSKLSFLKFLILSIFLWLCNFIGINFFNLFLQNSNFAAIIMVPFLIIISFTLQKYIVFR